MPSQIRMPRCVGCRGSSRKQRLFYARLVSTRAICRANVPLTTQRKRRGSCLFYSICYEITNEALVFGGDVMTATDITVHLGMVEFGDTQKLLIGNFPNFIIFSSFVLFFNCTSKSPLPLVHLPYFVMCRRCKHQMWPSQKGASILQNRGSFFSYSDKSSSLSLRPALPAKSSARRMRRNDAP